MHQKIIKFQTFSQAFAIFPSIFIDCSFLTSVLSNTPDKVFNDILEKRKCCLLFIVSRQVTNKIFQHFLRKF
jgi:hypothetical protein